ncbi:hypothetical protein RJ639_015789 [Escallonia herrerae]|uniref:starch synthase n=1 Tax=Escallonia herrerae TaxID=1293975 RepID=A0AA89AL81_9ASTE|nr:hypothetical protein RJ639_015789 [Escallonia herrerae]
MATELSTCFFSHGSIGQLNCNHVNVRYYRSPSSRSLAASCKMRQRNSSSQQKRQPAKRIFSEQLSTNSNLQPNGEAENDSENSTTSTITTSTREDVSDEHPDTTIKVEHSNEQVSTGLALLEDINIPSAVANEGEQLSGIHLQDLTGMIRHAEKNVNNCSIPLIYMIDIHLLNQARIRALEDVQKILGDKEALQGEINIKEMRLAETDARMRVAAQEKINVELLEAPLEKLQNELSSRGGTLEIVHDAHEIVPLAHNNGFNSLTEELIKFRTENMSLKVDLQALKAELSNVKQTDERVEMLEKERSLLESSLKDLETKLAVSQEDVAKLSSLESECKTVWEKVEHLQALLDNATKQADQAILVLQQNQELREKVDRLEESLEEANVYKVSSKKLQEYNELMQQKIKLLEERLQRSDEEIHSYVQLYQDSVKEFQNTLDTIKEESKRRTLDEPVDDTPREFGVVYCL